MDKKILVIDDENLFCKLIIGWLNNDGYKVLTAGDSESGYKIVEEEKPDFLLVDILLPGKSGIEFCQEIKKNVSLMHIPIILMSGVYKEFSLSRQIKNVSDGFIKKPFEKKELLSMLEKLHILSEDKTTPEYLYMDEQNKNKSSSNVKSKKDRSIKSEIKANEISPDSIETYLLNSNEGEEKKVRPSKSKKTQNKADIYAQKELDNLIKIAKSQKK